jgi:hypothetical protein
MSNAIGSAVEEAVMGSAVEGKAKKLSGVAIGAPSPGVFISPWTADSNQTSHPTVFQHGLGTIPKSLLILFSPDGDTVYPLQWSWASTSGNPVTVSMSATNITLNIFNGAPLHAIWSSANGWTSYTNGYWMVIAKASA